jgi:hypothetical protein
MAGTAALGVAATGLTGCSAPGGPISPEGSEPTGSAASSPGGSSTASPPVTQPTVSVFPGSVEAAALEDELAARAATVLAVGRRELGSKGRAVVSAVAALHRAHAAALRTSDPTDPGSAATGAPSPTTTPSGRSSTSFGKAVDRLVAAESTAAATHRAAALASTGRSSLLWGSLATSAGGLAAILEAADLAGDQPDPAAAKVAAVTKRAPMPVVTVVVAEQQLVAQLHAVVYGYQLALGRLTGTRRDTAAAELRRHRILRDRLTARLLDRAADVPVAAPAYVPSTNPRNATSAAKLIRQMETALVPFCGLWLTASDTRAARTEALGQVGRTAAAARQWGASLVTWPGWKPA